MGIDFLWVIFVIRRLVFFRSLSVFLFFSIFGFVFLVMVIFFFLILKRKLLVFLIEWWVVLK